MSEINDRETSMTPPAERGRSEIPARVARWKSTMGSAAPPLLPLRIPAGWLVRYNELRQIDPDKLSDDDGLWVYMNQDLMQLEASDEEKLLIDVGWYPDNDPAGEFGIKCVVDTDWARPVASFQARTLSGLSERLESLMARPPKVPVLRLIERLSAGTWEVRCCAAEALADHGAIETIDAISAAMRVEKIEPAYNRLSDARGRLIQKRVRDQKEQGDT